MVDALEQMSVLEFRALLHAMNAKPEETDLGPRTALLVLLYGLIARAATCG